MGQRNELPPPHATYNEATVRGVVSKHTLDKELGCILQKKLQLSCKKSFTLIEYAKLIQNILPVDDITLHL